MIRSMIIVYYINVLNETSLHIKKTSDLHRYNIVITTTFEESFRGMVERTDATQSGKERYQYEVRS